MLDLNKKKVFSDTATVGGVIMKASAVDIPRAQKKARRGTFIRRLLASMSLDEMLEASFAASMYLRGEGIPVIESNNAQTYVNYIIMLSKKPQTRGRAELMIRLLNAKIVEKNKKTIDSTEARKLYTDLMSKK